MFCNMSSKIAHFSCCLCAFFFTHFGGAQSLPVDGWDRTVQIKLGGNHRKHMIMVYSGEGDHPGLFKASA